MPDGSRRSKSHASTVISSGPPRPLKGGIVERGGRAVGRERLSADQGRAGSGRGGEGAAEIDAQEAVRDAQLRAEGPRQYDINDADAITFTTHIVTRSPERGPSPQRAVPGALPGPRRAIGRGCTGTRRSTRSRSRRGIPVAPGQRLHLRRAAAVPHVLDRRSTDATLENGCPWVAPGVHRAGHAGALVDRLGWRCLTTPGRRAGRGARRETSSCFSSLTPHRTGPEHAPMRCARPTSSSTRWTPTVQWARGAPGPVPQDDPDRQFWVVGGE